MPFQPLLILLLLTTSTLLTTTVNALGYLKTPRSRNLVAYEDTVWWPKTSTDPEPETTPQGLDRGGTLAQCGIVETLRNYDTPRNILGDDMPINVQAVYDQEDVITVEVSLISSNGGHFQFSLCPIEWGEIPTAECFEDHPLEFIQDNNYDATFDPNYPERIYVPDGKVTGRVDDASGFPGTKQLFSYDLALPCGLTGDLVLLQWYFVTAQDCYHEGYLEYDFPDSWGDVFEERINECPKPLPPTGDGLPLQYWNCAEVAILKTGSTDRCAPTVKPTLAPTLGVSVRPTKEPATLKPTQGEMIIITDEPTLQPSNEPTKQPSNSPLEEVRPMATCDELCLVPIDESECATVEDTNSIPTCFEPSDTDTNENFDSITPLNAAIASAMNGSFKVFRWSDTDTTTTKTKRQTDDTTIGKTININDICIGNGECNTSTNLNNCGSSDVYKRIPSCAKDDMGITPENTPISLPVLDNDVDGVGGGLTIVEFTEPEYGMVELGDDDELLYTPDDGYNGPDEFTYSVIDGNGFLSDADVTIEVLPVNDAPVANDDTATTPMNTNINIPVLANDFDPDNNDNDPITIDSITNQPTNGTAGIRPDGTVVYKPNPNFVGEDTFTYQICDTENLCDEATVTVNVEPPPNEPPVANDDFVTLSEGMNPGPIIPVLVNDNDPDGDELTVTDVSEPDNGSVEISPNGDGVIYTPNDDGFTGVDSFEYTACDPSNECDTAVVTVTVDPLNNDPIVFDDRENTPEGEPLVIDVLENDVPDVGLEVTDVTPASNGTCVITSDGEVEYTPDDGFWGQDECTYTACVEGTTDCDDGSIIVDVIEAPKQPPLAVDDPVTTNEDEPVTLDPLENDQSPSSSPLNLANITDDGENGNCEMNDIDGTVSYTPNPGFHGVDLCLYTVCDDNDLCDEGAIVVSVVDTNMPPNAQDDQVTTSYAPISVPVLDNDEDPNGDDLIVTDVTQGLHGNCSITKDNQVLYEPEPGYVGPDLCPYVVCDTSNECATANVFVDVEPGPPTAKDDQAQTTPDTPVNVDVLDNDSHPQDLPLEVTDITQPENGICEITDNQVQYTPNQGVTTGSDECVYTVCVEGTTECDEGTVTVDVVPEPKPDAEDDTTQTPPNTPISVDVLDNDTHPQGLPLEVTDIATQPENGVCEIMDGQVQYNPDQDYIGTDTCDYVVCVEGSPASCDEGTITVDVVPATPTVEDDNEQTPPNTSVTVDALDNDTQPQGLPLEITNITTQPENGVCEIINGQVQYVPNKGFIGSDSCGYVACIKGTAECDEGIVNVDVVPSAPVANDDTALTTPDTPVNVDVLDNDTHPQDLPLEVTDISTQPENGSCEVLEDQVMYSPNPGYIGLDSCEYVACVEGSEACDSAELVIDVVQLAPQANNDKERTPVNTPVLSDVLENDVNFISLSNPSASKPLAITEITTQPENGVCEVINGQVKFTPNQDFVGAGESCDYTVCIEGTSSCDTAMLIVDVVEVKIAEDDLAETPQDTPIVVSVLENDAHPEEPGTLVITDVTQPDNGSCEVIDNQVQYSPAPPEFSGQDECIYTVCLEENIQVCDEGLLTVDVIPKPVTEDDIAETPPNTPILVNVLDNDEPKDQPLDITSVTTPDNGVCEIIGSLVQYSPNQNYIGSDSCDYVVCVEGTTSCDEGTLTVAVTPSKPDAADDTAQTPPNTLVTVDVLDNDTQPQGLPLEVTDIGAQPENGVCEIINGQVQYIPNQNFIQGTDTCPYVACVEGTTECDAATVTIDVVPPEPNAKDDKVETPKDVPVIVSVLDNDAHPQDLPLQVIDIGSQPQNGVCEVVENQVKYTPSVGYVGTDSCGYIVCVEGTTSCDAANLVVDVVPPEVPITSKPTSEPTSEPISKPNTDPFAIDDFASTPANTPVVINVLINDFDTDGDALTVISITEPTNGWAEINTDNTITYYPETGYVGNDSFSYTISDGNGGSADATVFISVVQTVVASVPVQTDRPSMRPTMKPAHSLPAVLSCTDVCFEPLDPNQCPSCDPVILPKCSDPMEVYDLCEADGECGLDDQLNNCEGSFDVYRRVPCTFPAPEIPAGVCRPREGDSVTVSDDGDAYIVKGDDNGYNTDSILVTKYPPTDGVIKWTLPEDICECVTITKVILRLYALNSSEEGGFVHIMNPNWDEKSITWSDAPESSGPPLTQIGEIIADTWIDADVTSLVSNSDEHVAVRIHCLENEVTYASKEYMEGQFAPQLIIEFGPAPVGMHLLAERASMQQLSHYGGGRRLGRGTTRVTTHSGDINEDEYEESEPIKEIPVCPDPSLNLAMVQRSYVVDDATIVHAAQDIAFGSDILLEVSPLECGDMHVMLKFDTMSVTRGSPVEYASILIHAIEASSNSGAVFLRAPKPNNWSEDTVTWRSAPEYDKVIGSLSTIESGMWYEVDVTSAINSNLSSDHLSIRVIPSAAKDSCENLRLVFASKELNGFGPQLVVVPNKIEAKFDVPSMLYEAVDEVQYDDCSDTTKALDKEHLAVFPTADTYVSPKRKNENYGSSAEIFVDGRPGHISLIKFDISCLKSRSIKSAILKLYAIDGSINGGTFHVSSTDDSAWTEGLVTYNDIPPISNNWFTEQLRKVRSNTWVELDITNALVDAEGNGIGKFVTIIIDSTSDNRISYSSKEGRHPPQLVLIHGE